MAGGREEARIASYHSADDRVNISGGGPIGFIVSGRMTPFAGVFALANSGMFGRGDGATSARMGAHGGVLVRFAITFPSEFDRDSTSGDSGVIGGR